MDILFSICRIRSTVVPVWACKHASCARSAAAVASASMGGCKECGGGGICEHGLWRTKRKECGGGGICEHGRQRYECTRSAGGSGMPICEHGWVRRGCARSATAVASASMGGCARSVAGAQQVQGVCCLERLVF